MKFNTSHADRYPKFNGFFDLRDSCYHTKDLHGISLDHSNMALCSVFCS